MASDLDGMRILVPRSRTGRNVLADALRRKGADVVEFPDLAIELPSDLVALDAAVADASHFRWLVFSGEYSVVHFFARHAAALGPVDVEGRVAALGMGTVQALLDRDIRPTIAPRTHRPDAVLDALALAPGARVLLLREETAESELPDALRDAGAEVADVAGYRLEIRVDENLVRETFDERPDRLALANPTAARVLRRALDACGPEVAARLHGVPIAAAGPSTAEAARRYGFVPDLVAAGRLADLVRDVVARAGRPPTREEA